ncbi:MAG: hypothetical protein NZ770_02210 [Candidatus Poseidoniaceae archaeon]|nr:hypothetical protein [Candidatus Poseidoniaceae archaeon]
MRTIVRTCMDTLCWTPLIFWVRAERRRKIESLRYSRRARLICQRLLDEYSELFAA